MQPKHNLLQSKNVSFARSSCSCKSSSRHLVGSCQSATQQTPKSWTKKANSGQSLGGRAGAQAQQSEIFYQNLPHTNTPNCSLWSSQTRFLWRSSCLIRWPHNVCFTSVAVERRVLWLHLAHDYISLTLGFVPQTFYCTQKVPKSVITPKDQKDHLQRSSW